MITAAPAKAANTANATQLVYVARALRDFGDGFIVLLLPVYLAARGLGVFEIGVVATLGLFGSALMTLLIGLIGRRYGERTLLLLASALMVATGFSFALSNESAAIIFLIAFLGTINPSSGSVSIFVPLEHALLAHNVSDHDRTKTFAHYSLIGALAASFGSLAAATPQLLTQWGGMTPLNALQLMFCFYALLGFAGGAIYARIPRRDIHVRAPSAPLTRSRALVLKLAALFSLDSFAGGFAVSTLMALWLFEKFGFSLADAGLFFLVSGLLGACSQPASAWLGARIGLVNTMVWTHIPSSLALIGAAISPSLDLALALLLIRALLSQMDVPARSSYVMAVVAREERAAAASVTSVPRSLAAAASPAIAGALFAAGHSALPFILCGVLKIIYDIILLMLFRDVRPPEEMAPPPRPATPAAT